MNPKTVKTMKLQTLVASLGMAVALSTGVVGNAHADAVAQSDLQISSFKLSNAGGAALSTADFSQLTFLDQLTNTANLGGAPLATLATTSSFVPFVNAPMACVGSCGGQVENNFVAALIPPAPAATYARGDSLLTGAPINVPAVPLLAGATAQAIGETTLLGTATGGSTAAITLNSTIRFTLAHAVDALEISFAADKYLRAWTSPGSAVGTAATADMHWSLVLTDAEGAGNGTDLVVWNPNGGALGSGTHTGLTELADSCQLNQVTSAGANSPNAAITCVGLFDATVNFALLANHQYSLSIGHSIQTQATSIPEPGTVALLGLVFTGVWFARRRNV